MSNTRQWPLIINLGNSIIGVSVLAMPYCFSQCGIILGIMLLLSAAWLTSVSCTLLMRSALTTKRRSFEFLALHSYGAGGKLAVELTSIGLLIGTCIAFYVVIGDLGPVIISKVLDVANTSTLRTLILVCVAAVVVTPLGLLRDVESLNNISAASICFYVLLVSTVVIRALPNIISGVWINKVVFWRPDGMFKCLPIFAMAYGCQTQLFLMYNALAEPSLNQIVMIVKGAVSLCTVCYLSMGFFGYVAYCDAPISGDILMNFFPSTFAEALKLGFVLSVAVSFPLVIFPCRSSIQTLLFAPKTLHDNVIGGGSFMRVREMHFRTITMIIIIGTLAVGIAVPKIEFILGLTGSTMGSVICFVFPALIFLKVSPITGDNSRTLAKIVLILGILILFVSTFTTINNRQKESEVELAKVKKDLEKTNSDLKKAAVVKGKDAVVKSVKKTDEKQEKPPDKRQEPPIPLPPDDAENKKDDGKIKKTKSSDSKDTKVVKSANGNNNNGKSAELNKAVNLAVNKSVEKTKKEMDENLKKQHKILAQLEKQQKEQKQILSEQKKLLKEMKEHDKMHQSSNASSGTSGSAAAKSGSKPIVQKQVQAAPVAGQGQAAGQPVQNAVPQQNVGVAKQPIQAVVPQQNVAGVVQNQAAVPQQNLGAVPQQNQNAVPQYQAPQQPVQGVIPQQPVQGAVPQQKVGGVPQQPAQGAVPQNVAGVVPQQNQAAVPQQNQVPQQNLNVVPQQPAQGAVPQQNLGVPQQNAAAIPQESEAAVAQKNPAAVPQNQVPQQPFQAAVPQQNAAVPVQNQAAVPQQNAQVPQQNAAVPVQNQDAVRQQNQAAVPLQNAQAAVPQQNVQVPLQNQAAVPQQNAQVPQQNAQPAQSAGVSGSQNTGQKSRRKRSVATKVKSNTEQKNLKSGIKDSVDTDESLKFDEEEARLNKMERKVDQLEAKLSQKGKKDPLLMSPKKIANSIDYKLPDNEEQDAGGDIGRELRKLRDDVVVQKNRK